MKAYVKHAQGKKMYECIKIMQSKARRKKAMKYLSPAQFEVCMYVHKFPNRSLASIGRNLKLSRSAVHTHLKRAMNKFNEIFYSLEKPSRKNVAISETRKKRLFEITGRQANVASDLG